MMFIRQRVPTLYMEEKCDIEEHVPGIKLYGSFRNVIDLIPEVS